MQLLTILSTAFNAVLPIVFMIGLGYFLRSSNFISEEFVKIGNKLVFHVCLPCMLFVNVYEINQLSDIRWDVVMYTCLMIFVLFFIGVVAAVLTTREEKRRGVIAQSVFRSNMAIIGLSLAAAVGGDDAVAVAAIVSAFSVPFYNVLAVISLTMFLPHDHKNHFAGVLRNITRNPLIIGISLGMVCLLLREVQLQLFGMPVFLLSRDLKVVYTVLRNLNTITSPLALLILGGQFVFSAVRQLWKEVAVGTLCRIVVSPLVGIGCAVLLTNLGVLNFGPSEFPSLIAVFGSPTAVSSAIMARQMGNDEQLATQFVVWTSIGSVFTIFLTVCILMAIGMLQV